MTRINPQSRPIKSRVTTEKKLEDKTLILNLENGDYFSLDQTGTEVWSYLDGKHSVEEISEKLRVKFGERKERVLEDILSLLRSLKKAKLLS